MQIKFELFLDCNRQALKLAENLSMNICTNVHLKKSISVWSALLVDGLSKLCMCAYANEVYTGYTQTHVQYILCRRSLETWTLSCFVSRGYCLRQYSFGNAII